MKAAYKKSGKPQNLDLLPASYEIEHSAMGEVAQPHVGLNLDMVSSSSMGYAEAQQQFIPQPSMPAHMIKEVV